MVKKWLYVQPFWHHNTVSLYSCHDQQMSWDVSADAGSLDDKDVVVGAATAENTLTRFVITYFHD